MVTAETPNQQIVRVDAEAGELIALKRTSSGALRIADGDVVPSLPVSARRWGSLW
jgi:hypothetical protein